MSPYLDFEIGDLYNARGRALLYIRGKKARQAEKLQITLDINGLALREALYNEFLHGRLIVPEVFEPFYVTIQPCKETLSCEELLEIAGTELRDLIPVTLDDLEQETLAEALMEQAIARYTTLYRENVYLRLVRQLGQSVFRCKRRVSLQKVYCSIFKLAAYICLLHRARRDGDEIDFEYYSDLLDTLQPEIPFLQVDKIVRAIRADNGNRWRETADFIDAFFLTIKKHYPFPLDMDIYLQVQESAAEFLKQELGSLYEGYFLALIDEDYEMARNWKSSIDSLRASQSLEGCC